MSLRKGLKWLRAELGFTQTDLARAVHVSFTTINRWENGKTVPSAAIANGVMAQISKLAVSPSCVAYLKDAFFPTLETAEENRRWVDIPQSIITYTPNGMHRCYLSDPIHLEFVSDGLCRMTVSVMDCAG